MDASGEVVEGLDIQGQAKQPEGGISGHASDFDDEQNVGKGNEAQ
jgi:hypothetical protein